MYLVSRLGIETRDDQRPRVMRSCLLGEGAAQSLNSKLEMLLVPNFVQLNQRSPYCAIGVALSHLHVLSNHSFLIASTT